MTGTTMTLVDGSTTLGLTVSNSNRVLPGVVVRSYDLGFPTPREIVSDNSDQSGTQDLTTFFGSRVVKLECSIHDNPGTTKHQLYETLRTMCLPNHRPTLLVQCDGWAQQRSMVMRGTPASCVVASKHSAFLEASVAWVVPSGVMLSATTDLAIQPVATVSTGLSFTTGTNPATTLSFTTGTNPTATLNFVPGNLSDRAIATNSGNVPSGWVARFYGTAGNVQIKNLTTGMTTKLDMSIPLGHYVQVDSMAKTALIDNDPSNSAFGNIDFTVSSWWTLPASSDSVVSVSAQSSDASATCFFDFSSTWV